MKTKAPKGMKTKAPKVMKTKATKAMKTKTPKVMKTKAPKVMKTTAPNAGKGMDAGKQYTIRNLSDIDTGSVRRLSPLDVPDVGMGNSREHQIAEKCGLPVCMRVRASITS